MELTEGMIHGSNPTTATDNPLSNLVDKLYDIGDKMANLVPLTEEMLHGVYGSLGLPDSVKEALSEAPDGTIYHFNTNRNIHWARTDYSPEYLAKINAIFEE